MNRLAACLAAAVLVALAAPAFAGGKCATDTQTCLNKYSAAQKNYGWVGLELDTGEGAARVVKRVVENSPAAEAGFAAGDVLIALNGANLADDAAVKKAKGDWKPGAKVTYTVRRGAETLDLALTLGEMPEAVFAQIVGNHMLTEHLTAPAQAEAAKN